MCYEIFGSAYEFNLELHSRSECYLLVSCSGCYPFVVSAEKWINATGNFWINKCGGSSSAKYWVYGFNSRSGVFGWGVLWRHLLFAEKRSHAARTKEYQNCELPSQSIFADHKAIGKQEATKRWADFAKLNSTAVLVAKTVVSRLPASYRCNNSTPFFGRFNQLSSAAWP